MTRRIITRRSFLATGGAAVAAGAAGCLPDVDGEWPKICTVCSSTSGDAGITTGGSIQAGRVLEVHDAGLTSGRYLVEKVVADQMKKLLLALTGKVDLKGAWAALIPNIKAGAVVGIKVNMLSPYVPTHKEVVRALVDSLKTGLGLPAGQILVWDRRLDELTTRGLKAGYLGATVEGTWEDTDKKGTGRGYEITSICLGGYKTHLSNILTRRIDHLINVGVMKRHGESGFTGVLKNHYGSIDNPGCFHDQKASGGQVVVERRFEKAIPELNVLDEVTRKTCLWVMDATIGVCKGGTEDTADCFPNRLLVSLDPVALDVRGREIRDTERGAKLGKDPETVSDTWLKASEKAGLGKLTPQVKMVT